MCGVAEAMAVMSVVQSISVDASKRKFIQGYGIGADSPFNPNQTGTITGKKV